MTTRVFLIDDDENLLSSMRRQFRKLYEIQTATSGEEAVTMLSSMAPPAVVVCDMRMGGMNGVETLAKIRDICPDTVRLMLTGNADMQTAIDAINTGQIFRFFTKPCPPELMQQGLDAALEQYRLVTAERELLEKTLAGSVKVLIDTLSMASPHAFKRASRVRGWVQKVGPALQLTGRWRIEIAAMLSPLGLLSVPAPVLIKYQEREALTDVEQAMIARSPEAAKTVISNIPRLKTVADIVYLQNKGFDGSGYPKDGPKGSEIPREARILKILNALSEVCKGESPSRSTFEALYPKRAQYDPALMERIRTILEVSEDLANEGRPSVAVDVGALLPDMVLARDVVAADGRLVLSAMTLLSETHVESLRNLARLKQVAEQVQVFEDTAHDLLG